jgi:hypothetical protein
MNEAPCMARLQELQIHERFTQSPVLPSPLPAARMARPHESISSLDQLRTASTTSQRLAAIRRLKNDIIGHPDKKEAVIFGGGVELLVDLCKSRRLHGKNRSNDTEWTGLAGQPVGVTLEDDSQIQLQAIHVVSSLVAGLFSSTHVFGANNCSGKAHDRAAHVWWYISCIAFSTFRHHCSEHRYREPSNHISHCI